MKNNTKNLLFIIVAGTPLIIWAILIICLLGQKFLTSTGLWTSRTVPPLGTLEDTVPQNPESTKESDNRAEPEWQSYTRFFYDRHNRIIREDIYSKNHNGSWLLKKQELYQYDQNFYTVTSTNYYTNGIYVKKYDDKNRLLSETYSCEIDAVNDPRHYSYDFMYYYDDSGRLLARLDREEEYLTSTFSYNAKDYTGKEKIFDKDSNLSGIRYHTYDQNWRLLGSVGCKINEIPEGVEEEDYWDYCKYAYWGSYEDGLLREKVQHDRTGGQGYKYALYDYNEQGNQIFGLTYHWGDTVFYTRNTYDEKGRLDIRYYYQAEVGSGWTQELQDGSTLTIALNEENEYQITRVSKQGTLLNQMAFAGGIQYTGDNVFYWNQNMKQNKDQQKILLAQQRPVLEIPQEYTYEQSPPSLYVIQEGDTLWALAEQFCGNPALYFELAKLNHIREPDKIYAGDILRLPQSNTLRPQKDDWFHTHGLAVNQQNPFTLSAVFYSGEEDTPPELLLPVPVSTAVKETTDGTQSGYKLAEADFTFDVSEWSTEDKLLGVRYYYDVIDRYTGISLMDTDVDSEDYIRINWQGQEYLAEMEFEPEWISRNKFQFRIKVTIPESYDGLVFQCGEVCDNNTQSTATQKDKLYTIDEFPIWDSRHYFFAAQ